MDSARDQAESFDGISPGDRRPNGGRQLESAKLAPIFGGG